MGEGFAGVDAAAEGVPDVEVGAFLEEDVALWVDDDGGYAGEVE